MDSSPGPPAALRGRPAQRHRRPGCRLRHSRPAHRAAGDARPAGGVRPASEGSSAAPGRCAPRLHARPRRPVLPGRLRVLLAGLFAPLQLRRLCLRLRGVARTCGLPCAAHPFTGGLPRLRGGTQDGRAGLHTGESPARHLLGAAEVTCRPGSGATKAPWRGRHRRPRQRHPLALPVPRPAPRPGAAAGVPAVWAAPHGQGVTAGGHAGVCSLAQRRARRGVCGHHIHSSWRCWWRLRR